VAYRFNGETFQSVATRNVGGRFLDAVRADLEGIADRRIVLALEVADEGAACCTTRRTAFSLQRGQLVEVADPDRTDVDGPSQSEGASPGCAAAGPLRARAARRRRLVPRYRGDGD